MKLIKTISLSIRHLLKSKFKRLHLLISLFYNYLQDFILYKRHSSVFNRNSFGKIESEIVLRYHSIEKGFLNSQIRFRFAKNKVEELISLIRIVNLTDYKDRLHIQAALINLCNYYEIHSSNNIDISDFFCNEDYNYFKQLIINNYPSTKFFTKESYFHKTQSNFIEFSTSRCSVRDFKNTKIPINIIRQVIDLANNAPSVCNRQPINVIFTENRSLIDRIFEIQGGLKGFSKKVHQLIILTSNRNYYYSPGERNQLFVDGGIYLMNLLYALHYYNIGACPAHWGMHVNADKIMRKLLNMPESFHITCLIAIGIPEDEFSTTLSLKKGNLENFNIID